MTAWRRRHHPSLQLTAPAPKLVQTPMELFVDLNEANVGFKHWHPMPVTQNGDKLSGLGEMGGLWEWTSLALEKQEGYEPTKLYPAYSCTYGWTCGIITSALRFVCSRLLRRQAQRGARWLMGHTC